MMIMDTPRPSHEAARQKLEADIDQFLRAGGRIIRIGTTFAESYRDPWKYKSRKGYDKRHAIISDTGTE